jgi:hypothetical protein
MYLVSLLQPRARHLGQPHVQHEAFLNETLARRRELETSLDGWWHAVAVVQVDVLETKPLERIRQRRFNL